MFILALKQTNNFLMKFTESEIIKDIAKDNDGVKIIEIDDIDSIDHNLILKQIIEE